MTESTPNLIRAVEQADSAARLVTAVRNLAAATDETGISTLIAVLGYNNPEAAVAAVEGLIELGKAAVQPLMELDGYNYGARAYAIRALAAIASPRALDVLATAAADDFAPSVRRAAAQGLGRLRWDELNAQDRSLAQTQALQTLNAVYQDSDWSIRYAAVVGLQGLSAIQSLQAQIQSQFEQMAQTEPDIAVQARIYLAQKLFVPM